LPLDDVLGANREAAFALHEEALDRCRDLACAVALDAGDDLVDVDRVTRGGKDLGPGRDRQRRVIRLGALDLDLRSALATKDLDDAVDVADLGLALWHAGLEQLLDARQTGRDVESG